MVLTIAQLTKVSKRGLNTFAYYMFNNGYRFCISLNRRQWALRTLIYKLMQQTQLMPDKGDDMERPGGGGVLQRDNFCPRFSS